MTKRTLQYQWPGEESPRVGDVIATCQAHAESLATRDLRAFGMIPCGEWFGSKGQRARLFLAKRGDTVIFSVLAHLA